MSGPRSTAPSGSIRGSAREASEGLFMTAWNRKDGASSQTCGLRHCPGSTARPACDSAEAHKARLGASRTSLRPGFNVEEKFLWICKSRLGQLPVCVTAAQASRRGQRTSQSTFLRETLWELHPVSTRAEPQTRNKRPRKRGQQLPWNLQDPPIHSK